MSALYGAVARPGGARGAGCGARIVELTTRSTPRYRCAARSEWRARHRRRSRFRLARPQQRRPCWRRCSPARAAAARFVPLNWRLAAPELAHDRDARRTRRLVMRTPRFSGAEGLAPARMGAADTRQRRRRPAARLYQRHDRRAQGRAAHAGRDAGQHRRRDRRAGLRCSTRTLAVLPLFHVGGLCIQVLADAGGRGRGASCSRASMPARGSTTWQRGGRRPACWCRRRCAR